MLTRLSFGAAALAQCAVASRAASTSRSLLHLEDSGIKGVTVMSMANQPVNSFSVDMLQQIIGQLETFAEPSSGCRGVVLTSACRDVFSAGLDLNYLTHKLTREEFFPYYKNFQQLFNAVQHFPLPIAAAINGSAAAGGCILSLWCDYRVMAEQSSVEKHGKHRTYHLGVPAVRSGFAVPYFLASSLMHVVGPKKTEDILCQAEQYETHEALKAGLVDEMVKNDTEVVPAALREIERYLAGPASNGSHMYVKDMMRHNTIRLLGTEEDMTRDAEWFFDHLSTESVHLRLTAYFDTLSKVPKTAPSST